jgi:flagellar biosynthesis protein FlhG
MKHKKDQQKPRAIAVISTKGGSGKTMITIAAAQILGRLGKKVLIVDADTSTAGMTNYLLQSCNLNAVDGLADVIIHGIAKLDDDMIKPLPGIKNVHLLAIGIEHETLNSIHLETEIIRKISVTLQEVLKRLLAQHEDKIILVDCRGGLNKETVAVCEIMDEILIITEPDNPANIATRNLIKFLNDRSLGRKITGFIINKVFSDPDRFNQNIEHLIDSLIKNREIDLKCSNLATIPFDHQAIKNYFLGKTPSLDSIFSIHVGKALTQIFPEIESNFKGKIWQSQDFKKYGLANPNSILGGKILGMLCVVCGVTLIIENLVSHQYISSVFALLLTLFGLFASEEKMRRLAGKLQKKIKKKFSRFYLTWE